MRTSPEVIHLTDSAGVVEAGAGAGAAAPLRAVEAALYRAKEGRNRIATVPLPGPEARAGSGPGV